MTQINFRKLMTTNRGIAPLVAALLAALPGAAAVTDADGTLLVGHDPGCREEYPILLDGEVVGRVIGDEGAALLATVLAYVIEREAEKRSLARDGLDKYRELNLLYELSEKIGASLEVQSVATVAIEEACRRIKVGEGFVLVLEEATGMLEPIALPAEAQLLVTGIPVGEGVIGQIAESGRAEVIVDLDADPRWSARERNLRSLVCAPLKARQRVIGVLGIGSAESTAYTAADLKFLSTIASQAAPAVDHAMLYARTVREAQERERRLQLQVAELRIEVDQARQSQQVSAITETDYFKSLREQANDLRKDLRSSA